MSACCMLAEGVDLSEWGLANTGTRVAQEAPTYDRTTDLEFRARWGWLVARVCNRRHQANV